MMLQEKSSIRSLIGIVLFLLFLFNFASVQAKAFENPQANTSSIAEKYGLQLSLSSDSACAILESGVANCWGYYYFKKFADGSFSFKGTPVVVSPVLNAAQLSLGALSSCAVLKTGTVKCWDKNLFGHDGDGSFASRRTPEVIPEIDDAVQVSVGLYSNCAVLTAGSIKCWGINEFGGLGNGTFTSSSTPVSVIGISNATEVSVDYGYACAVLKTGFVKCWGSLGLQQGSFESSTPVEVSGLANIRQVSVGRNFACALDDSGVVSCWGRNNLGQLGDGSTIDRLTPFEVTGVSNVVQLAAGGSSICALIDSGVVKCWGFNHNGALDGEPAPEMKDAVAIPTEVDELSGVVQIASGTEATCALLNSGRTKCWGYDTGGVLGTTLQNKYTPIPEINRNFPALRCETVSTNSVALKWTTNLSAPDDQVTDYLVRYRKFGDSSWVNVVHDPSAQRSVTVSGLTPGTFYEFEVTPVINAIAGEVNSIAVATNGLGTLELHVSDSDGKALALGRYSWVSEDGLNRSSSPKVGTALGSVTFSSVPAKRIKLTVSDAVFGDGTTVSGTFKVQASNGELFLVLPKVPQKLSAMVRVILASGDPVPNATVSSNLSSTIPLSDENFTGSISYSGGTRGLTDQNGNFKLDGFATGEVKVSATYDDGQLNQSTEAVTIVGGNANLQLDYMPVVQLTADQLTTNVNTLVSIPVSVGDGAASANVGRASLKADFVRASSYSGATISVTPPKGASQKACKSKSQLRITTNSLGRGTLKVCASASGDYKITSRGAVSAGAVTIHVRKSKPMPVTSLGVSNSGPNKLLIAWGLPEFDGASALKSYTITATAGKLKKVVVIKRGSSSFSSRSLNLTGLAANKTWTVKVSASNRYGTSDTAAKSIIVSGLK